MNLIEKHHCYLIYEPSFQKTFVAGFTKTDLPGELPGDILAISSSLPVSPSVSYLNQVHSCRIHEVDEAGVYEGDGLFTDSHNHLLTVRTADCLPLFFSSTRLGVAGVVHMGWRSANEGILGNIPYELSSFTVIAGVGMRQCCYEVGPEFASYRRFTAHISRRGDSLFFDPVAFARDTLIAQGLPEDAFRDTALCSVCSEHQFYSYRRTRAAQRTLSFIVKT